MTVIFLDLPLCGWLNNFSVFIENFLKLQKVISYVLGKLCVSSKSSQETETTWVVKETLMQKIDSVGDERAEILNTGHWGNPKINNSRKPPPTTDGIKGKGKASALVATWGSWNYRLARPAKSWIHEAAGREGRREIRWFIPPHRLFHNPVWKTAKHGNQCYLLI